MGVETQIRLRSGQATLKHYCKDCCKGQKLIVMLAEPQGLGREFAFLGGVDKTRGHDAGESGVPRNGPHLRASCTAQHQGVQRMRGRKDLGPHLSVNEVHLQITNPGAPQVRAEQMGKQLGLSCLVLWCSGNPRCKEKRGNFQKERGQKSIQKG